ncbi:MAG: S1/P1 nuclease [Puia sp.]|nr:S1/P1 nuclease [Puia sp.]
MNTPRRSCSAWLLPFFFLPFHAGAWGLLGHRIVGGIADTWLTPKARVEIQKILGTETLAMTSNWADFIKSEPSYSYLSPWHYVDMRDSLSYPDVQAYFKTDTATDAYTKINFLVRELKNKKLPKDKQLFYLRLLVHIVGDIHQPLHVGRPEDQGGNTIKVQWFNEPANLHNVWDEKLIGHQLLSYTEYIAAINHVSPAQRLSWQKQPLSEWIFESYTISRQLYREINEPGQKLGYRYNFDHLATLNEQLLKAGVRLAGLLNEIFG